MTDPGTRDVRNCLGLMLVAMLAAVIAAAGMAFLGAVSQ